MSGSIQTIILHQSAPAKPAAGAACNGCGVCCAAELCPVGILLFLKRRGSCPALLWQEDALHYRCGLLTDPGHCLCWLPRHWNARASRFFARRIAAGQGCDCSAEVLAQTDVQGIRKE